MLISYFSDKCFQKSTEENKFAQNKSILRVRSSRRLHSLCIPYKKPVNSNLFKFPPITGVLRKGTDKKDIAFDVSCICGFPTEIPLKWHVSVRSRVEPGIQRSKNSGRSYSHIENKQNLDTRSWLLEDHDFPQPMGILLQFTVLIEKPSPRPPPLPRPPKLCYVGQHRPLSASST